MDFQDIPERYQPVSLIYLVVKYRAPELLETGGTVSPVLSKLTGPILNKLDSIVVDDSSYEQFKKSLERQIAESFISDGMAYSNLLKSIAYLLAIEKPEINFDLFVTMPLRAVTDLLDTYPRFISGLVTLICSAESLFFLSWAKGYFEDNIDHVKYCCGKPWFDEVKHGSNLNSINQYHVSVFRYLKNKHPSDHKRISELINNEMKSRLSVNTVSELGYRYKEWHKNLSHCIDLKLSREFNLTQIPSAILSNCFDALIPALHEYVPIIDKAPHLSESDSQMLSVLPKKINLHSFLLCRTFYEALGKDINNYFPLNGRAKALVARIDSLGLNHQMIAEAVYDAQEVRREELMHSAHTLFTSIFARLTFRQIEKLHEFLFNPLKPLEPLPTGASDELLNINKIVTQSREHPIIWCLSASFTNLLANKRERLTRNEREYIIPRLFSVRATQYYSRDLFENINRSELAWLCYVGITGNAINFMSQRSGDRAISAIEERPVLSTFAKTLCANKYFAQQFVEHLLDIYRNYNEPHLSNLLEPTFKRAHEIYSPKIKRAIYAAIALRSADRSKVELFGISLSEGEYALFIKIYKQCTRHPFIKQLAKQLALPHLTAEDHKNITQLKTQVISRLVAYIISKSQSEVPILQQVALQYRYKYDAKFFSLTSIAYMYRTEHPATTSLLGYLQYDKEAVEIFLDVIRLHNISDYRFTETSISDLIYNTETTGAKAYIAISRDLTQQQPEMEAYTQFKSVKQSLGFFVEKAYQGNLIVQPADNFCVTLYWSFRILQDAAALNRLAGLIGHSVRVPPTVFSLFLRPSTFMLKETPENQRISKSILLDTFRVISRAQNQLSTLQISDSYLHDEFTQEFTLKALSHNRHKYKYFTIQGRPVFLNNLEAHYKTILKLNPHLIVDLFNDTFFSQPENKWLLFSAIAGMDFILSGRLIESDELKMIIDSYSLVSQIKPWLQIMVALYQSDPHTYAAIVKIIVRHDLPAIEASALFTLGFINQSQLPTADKERFIRELTSNYLSDGSKIQVQQSARILVDGALILSARFNQEAEALHSNRMTFNEVATMLLACQSDDQIKQLFKTVHLGPSPNRATSPIKSLYINGFHESLITLHPVLEWLKNSERLPQLSTLNISACTFPESGFESFEPILPQLDSVNINFCNLTKLHDESFAVFSPEKLTHFSMVEVNITRALSTKLFRTLSQYPLESFELSHCGEFIDNQLYKHVDIQQLKHLIRSIKAKTLIFSDNQWPSDVTISVINSVLSPDAAVNLLSFDLSGSLLDDECIEAIIQKIDNAPQLTTLNLCYHNASSEKIIQLLEKLQPRAPLSVEIKPFMRLLTDEETRLLATIQPAGGTEVLYPGTSPLMLFREQGGLISPQIDEAALTPPAATGAGDMTPLEPPALRRHGATPR